LLLEGGWRVRKRSALCWFSRDAPVGGKALVCADILCKGPTAQCSIIAERIHIAAIRIQLPILPALHHPHSKLICRKWLRLVARTKSVAATCPQLQEQR
jgi:selenophosphate synthetase-related protein